MLKPKSHGMLLVLVVAAVIVAAGGLATASNTGFKINKSLVVVLAGATDTKGNNFLSIPYFNPYSNYAGFCAATGLVSAGLTRASGVVYNTVSGVPSPPANCGTPAAASLTWNAGQGLRVRNAGVGAPASIIIVGSHNPTTVITMSPTSPTAVAQGNNWFAVPYHTTAVTANDLCLSSGLTSTGISRASVVRFDAALGSPTPPANCGTAAATAFVLQLGEAVKLREPNAPKTFIPAHF